MPDPEFKPEWASELAEATQNVTSMTDAELQQGWAHWMAVEENVISTPYTPQSKGLEALASDGGMSLDDKEAKEDWEAYGRFADRMAGLHRAELARRGLELKSGYGQRPEWGPVYQKDPTGYYDDGHSFGWKAAPKPKTTTGLPMPLIAMGAAVVVVISAVGIALANNKPATTSGTATAGAIAATNAAAATSRPAPETCTVVTVDEAASILKAAPTTAGGTAAAGAVTVAAVGTTPPGQCEYRPAQRFVISFSERDRTAQIRLDAVVVSVYTGDQAAARWKAKLDAFVSNKTASLNDLQVSGLGDKAIYTGQQELSVLRGTTFVNVNTRSDRDWGSGDVRYDDVHQTYLGILTAFARAALPRLP